MAAWVVGAASPVAAYPVHRRLYQEAYGGATSCQLCHGYEGDTHRNLYGEAWHARGETVAAFAAIESLDSDGDGATNLAEIEGGSNPGDGESTPDAPGDRWERSKEQLFIPLEQLELVFDDMARVEAAEVELDEAQVADVESAIGAELTVEDRLPTFYFNVVGERRDEVAVFHHMRDARGKYALLTSIGRDGTASRVIVFRAPGEEGDLYLPYLSCLAGKSKDELPEPGEGGCPSVQGHDGTARALRVEVRKVLYLTAAVLRDLRGRATPDEAEAGEPGDPSRRDRAEDEGDGELEFEAAEADGEMSVMPSSTASILALLLVAIYLASIALVARWAEKRAGTEPHVDRARIDALPMEVRLALSLVVLGLMLAQSVAIVDAYVQTQVVNESTWSYFQHLSTARLLGTSHSHLFGYTVTYGVLALLFSMTGASIRVRMLVIAALLLTGPFDVLSWWAQKLWSPRFDWLTLATGAVAGSASIVAAIRVWRDALLAKRS